MPIGPRYDKYLKRGIVDTGKELPFRPEDAIDRDLGKRRHAYQIGTSFWGWPLWERYRTWHQYMAEKVKK